MSDLNGDELEREFRRQIYLCQGLGRYLMEAIVVDAFEDGHPEIYVCPKCNARSSFLKGHLCE